MWLVCSPDNGPCAEMGVDIKRRYKPAVTKNTNRRTPVPNVLSSQTKRILSEVTFEVLYLWGVMTRIRGAARREKNPTRQLQKKFVRATRRAYGCMRVNFPQYDVEVRCGLLPNAFGVGTHD